MGLEDFLNLTPFEFRETWQAWVRNTEHKEKQLWERTRWQVFRSLCPPKGNQLGLTDFIIFPWEKDKVAANEPKESTQDRFEALKNKWNG